MSFFSQDYFGQIFQMFSWTCLRRKPQHFPALKVIKGVTTTVRQNDQSAIWKEPYANK